MRSIDKEIENFIHSIKDLWAEDPLDGDDTERIANKVLAGLNFVNANT